ncbi:hypothetical protein [Halobaculum marinum]|uniref:Uncharacterized protein n=1 Tax=Halobaculum marinum TaxID=3031996 RepID=A0ABD5WV23_9EURY|nr:hypothetical protein [Halobaculum sp. DT55]
MNRRQYAALVGTTALGGAGVVRAGGANTDGGEAERTADVPRAQEDPTPTTTPTPDSSSTGFGPQTFTGAGTGTTEEFDLQRGPITATFSVDGDSAFTAQLLAVEGQSYDDVYLAILLAPAAGSQVATVSVAGPHVLNVETDGAWEVTLAQPTATTGQSLPVEASGSGPAYVDLVAFDGVTRVSGTHEGSSNFIVETVPLDPDDFGELLFNEIGQFEGTTTARIDGPSYVNVNADGDWTLSFE